MIFLMSVLFFTSLEEVDAADALTRDRRETRELTPLRLQEEVVVV